ncbi:ABC transporter ATP-binding protein [Collinsella provencensis]|uniref:ABC transporter ATP-binding protein n=1 Tax=Collinsella provencensis TaxID=1937461 RepID=UPI000C85E969|nr:ABC transporter ATP-binding protein [Collinsella provencensis]
MAIFEIKDLTFSYPDAQRPALCGINMAVEPGEFVVVCGKSGCGKSTLLRHLKTALTPHGARSGEVRFEGRALENVSVREQAGAIGYVLQSPDAQIVTDKVWHELAFGLENLGLDQQVIRLRVAEMASFFAMQPWFDKRVDELSGGQKQLLNLASVMAMQPRVLVIDEPTAQLDPLTAREFLDTIHHINVDLGTTVIMVEHRLEDVLPLADKVLVLEQGRQLLYGDPRTVGHNLVGNELFLTMPSPMRIMEGSQLGGDCPLTVREGRVWLDDRLDAGASTLRVHAAPDGLAGSDSSLQNAGDSSYSVGFAAQEACDGYSVVPKNGDVVLRCQEVWFRYERRAPDVLRGLTMEVRRGELFCLLGANGTGKSTALGVLAGLLQPYRGDVQVFGRKLRRGELATSTGGVGMLPQDSQCLFAEDTVRADLEEMLLDRKDMAPDERACKVERMAELVEITHLLDMHPYDLSGGEQQRAALAKVLLLEPKILLLDEPTKGLDGLYKEKLAHIFTRLRAQGVTILMVSHDVEFCAAHGGRFALLFDGSIVSKADANTFFCGNSFYTTAANRMARHLFPNAITVEEVVHACKDATRRL